MFAQDEETAALLRQASAYKSAKNMAEAIVVLRLAKARMLVSPVDYSPEQWCKLPLYLQAAGRFDEALQEFAFLQQDIERLATHCARVDQAATAAERKRRETYRKGILTHYPKIYREKLALVQKREAKAKQ